MKISLPDFALRHFEKGAGTYIETSPDVFIERVNTFVQAQIDRSKSKASAHDAFFVETDVNGKFKGEGNPMPLNGHQCELRDSFMPFCKYLVMENLFDVCASSLPITLENSRYLRSGYTSRREGELPYLARWFDLPVKAPVAEYLILILYSADQLNKEGVTTNADYGIVGMQATMTPKVEPMTPYTMVRNAMGIEEGGNGEEIDKEYLIEAAKFWDEHAIVN